MTNTLTAQEVFTTVVLHLRKQGRRAVEEKNGVFYCRYRASDGASCAVGCLLTDDEATKNIEGMRVYDLVAQGLLPKRLLPHRRLLSALQDVHDYESVWERKILEPYLARVATTFGLKMPEAGC